MTPCQQPTLGTALLLARLETSPMWVEDVRTIEIRRLRELEKQAALNGPRTEPEILIEIQDLYHKYPESRRDSRTLLLANLDYDFLMNTVAAALLRFNQLEQSFKEDTKKRKLRQFIHDLWMVAITTMVFIALLLLLLR